MGGDRPCSPPPPPPPLWDAQERAAGRAGAGEGGELGVCGWSSRCGGGLRCPQKPGGPGPGEGQTSAWGLGGPAAGVTGWGPQEVRASPLGLQPLLSANLRAQASVLLESSLPSSLFVAPLDPLPLPPRFALNPALISLWVSLASRVPCLGPFLLSPPAEILEAVSIPGLTGRITPTSASVIALPSLSDLL